ncbi:ASN_collapsed_G0006380.mRNA.1.CDS.1 [Saccharomyces cerevisiae]|nr:ASN_collapsed_G0006380.mRNA.1.CDS.1 [Saccharomyces cerevisiae]
MMNEDISIIDGQNSFLTEKSTVLLTQAKRTLEDEKEMITPPSSTVRKTMKEVNKRPSHPLSPDHSSPIAPSKAKRQRSDTCARSNGNLTLEEILQSLERRRINGELAKKPPYSYATLICLAILQSQEGKLTLSQIYHWIHVHFPYYKQKDASWQNSIRHNLSLNDAFIKTEKSCDGKGHFWEVRPGAETKFFKGENRGYEFVKDSLQDIGKYFEIDSTLDELEQVESGEGNDDLPDEEEREEAGKFPSLEIQLNSSLILRVSQLRHIPQLKTDNSVLNPHENLESMRNMIENDVNNIDSLEPPYVMKKYHTSLGLPSLVDAKDHFQAGVKNNNITQANRFNTLPITSAKSPQNFRKYFTSFNSNFEDLSPLRSNVGAGSLLDPLPYSPLKLYDQKNLALMSKPQSQQSYSNSQLPPPPSSHGSDLLKTPKMRHSDGLEKTPSRLISTPKDGNSILRKWQTPSHLFEDLYCSPLFRAIETPIRYITTPGGTLETQISPRKSSAPDVLTSATNSKFASSGLFGVDVYSVWKRATEKISDGNNTTDSNQKHHPYHNHPSNDSGNEKN